MLYLDVSTPFSLSLHFMRLNHEIKLTLLGFDWGPLTAEISYHLLTALPRNPRSWSDFHGLSQFCDPVL